MTKEDFLNDIIQDIRSYIDTVKGEADDLEKEIGICPECNTPVLEKRFEYACATPGCFKLGKVIKEKNDISQYGKGSASAWTDGMDQRLPWKKKGYILRKSYTGKEN